MNPRLRGDDGGGGTMSKFMEDKLRAPFKSPGNLRKLTLNRYVSDHAPNPTRRPARDAGLGFLLRASA